MSHRPQLDGLRFFAFLAVFLYHANQESVPWGWAGVQFFFALSGFLITRILIQSESGVLSADLRRFYYRRTLRIFPLYYAMIVLVASTQQLNGTIWYVTYLYNIRAYFDRSLNNMLGHFWTLCVEEHFYLLFPLALLFTPARRRVALVIALLAGSKAFQVYAHANLFMPSARILLPYCGEDLLWGCLAGLVDLRSPSARRLGTPCLFAGVAFLYLAWNLHKHHTAWPVDFRELLSVSLFGIGSALVVFGAWRTTDRWIIGPLSWAPLAYLGRISYGLYAIHYPVLNGRWLDQIPYAFLIPRPYGDLALTIGMAAASWRFFEGPINRLKDRAPGSPAVAPGTRSDLRPVSCGGFDDHPIGMESSTS